MESFIKYSRFYRGVTRAARMTNVSQLNWGALSMCVYEVNPPRNFKTNLHFRENGRYGEKYASSVFNCFFFTAQRTAPFSKAIENFRTFRRAVTF